MSRLQETKANCRRGILLGAIYAAPVATRSDSSNDLLRDRWVTPMWLAHHYPEDYNRCVRIGRIRLCRRCLALYPVAFAVMAICLMSGFTGGPGSTVLLVALPLPAVIELVAEQLGLVRYRPLRQVGVTVPLGIGLGVGFARYLEHPGDLGFWAVIAVYGGITLAAIMWRWRRG